MPIKSSQTLISEALKEIKTISPAEALKLSNENKCNLIDIRDAVELQSEGRIENSFHISRGLLEFAIHPDSPYAKKENSLLIVSSNSQRQCSKHGDSCRYSKDGCIKQINIDENLLEKIGRFIS